jgi:hypothetical protein
MSGSYFYHHWRDFGENNQVPRGQRVRPGNSIETITNIDRIETIIVVSQAAML